MIRDIFDKASTQAIIALMLTTGILLMPWFGIEIPELLGAAMMAAIGFYFGTKAAE